MRPSLTKAILFALVVLQCTHLVYSQQQQQQDQASGNVVSGQQQSQQQEQQQSSSDAPAATSAPVVATTTTPPPAATTTTEAPQSSSTQAPDTKTDATVAPTSTTTTAAPTSDAPVVPSSTSEAGKTSSQSKRPVQPTTSMISSNGSLVPTVITPTDSTAQPTESGAANKKDDGDSGSNKTAVIAGSVVGGLVGIALIAGLLTWMNRRGGCTSRTRRRDVQEDFTNENDYKMTENAAAAGAIGAGAGAMHSTDNLPPPSPFQHARRFVPPTSNPTGYMNLQDEEYGYHQNANVGGAGYQPQQYQDYNAGGVYHDGSHPDYNQDYQQQEYYNNHEYAAAAHDYSADGSVTGSNHGGYQQQAYYGHVPGSNVTSPTLTNSAAAAPLHQMKPDQVEQKPNVA
ncbi:hypothetical protein FB192DRAFT_1348418 [Mucor lusitanicus]|uniref:Mid2 domain-containing protein n=1 Tax=Mucor circinelloides f. lusitanicus TaxID=29924 RepID=A0A8H4BP73_MUCCL|nr:hypothetical protein FB192DRAFT_1348418 [Mucor lusitanicus]